MAITYSWKVTGMKKLDQVDELNNVVIHVTWEKIGTDENGNEGKFSGATPLSPPDPENFVSLESLTEETVISWIQAVVVDGYEEHVNERIQKQIDEQVNPVSEVTLPWATSEEVPVE